MESNLSLVEGQFKNFTIRRVRPQDIERVVEHIKKYFLRDEPLSKLCGYSEEYGEEFCHAFKYFLPLNLSFWVEDNESGEVAAVRSTLITRKGDDCWSTFPRNAWASKVMTQMVEEAEEKSNLFERFKINEYGDFYIASCAPKYRNQGLATELYKRSLSLLKAEGLSLAMSVFTNPYSRAAAKSLGFKEICRVYFKELRDKEGKQILEGRPLNDEHFGALMIKQL